MQLLESYNVESDKDKLKITFAPLGRNQRVQTALASRPQAGKKLYQNLAIPLWMRESLVVVSVAFMNKESSENGLLENEYLIELPILLISPFASWALNAAQANISVDVKQLVAFINSHLTLHKTC